ncbi:MAG: response regulator [Bacteroidales bacterium]
MKDTITYSPIVLTDGRKSLQARPADVILIADDNPDGLYLLGNILIDAGYEVELACDGFSAVEWAGIRKFDAVLLDVRMPVMNGFEAASSIRKTKLNNETPIIFLTSYFDTAISSGAFESAFTDYVTRPFRKRELLSRIRTKVDEAKEGRKFRQYMEEIESRNLYIRQSLEYSVYIQNAVMKSAGVDPESVPEHFLLSLPRDIISGDFHCFYRSGDMLTAVIMDCTGHGVPGALMSILGITLCNEIALNEKITRPDEMLNRLRYKLLQSLGKGSNHDQIPDGMEGAVIRYDEKSKLLQYSGSFNPLLIVRQGKLTGINGDRMPIGYSDVSLQFTLREFQVESGDMIYLFTDGFADQFGGEQNKKFMISRLRNLIQSVSDLPVEIQKKSLLSGFMAWKGKQEQTDDVLVLGLRL